MSHIHSKEVHTIESFLNERHTTPYSWCFNLFFILDDNESFVEKFILYDWENYKVFDSIENVVYFADRFKEKKKQKLL